MAEPVRNQYDPGAPGARKRPAPEVSLERCLDTARPQSRSLPDRGLWSLHADQAPRPAHADGPRHRVTRVDLAPQAQAQLAVLVLPAEGVDPERPDIARGGERAPARLERGLDEPRRSPSPRSPSPARATPRYAPFASQRAGHRSPRRTSRRGRRARARARSPSRRSETQGSTWRPLSGAAGSSDATAQGRASGGSAPRATRRRPRPANPGAAA